MSHPRTPLKKQNDKWHCRYCNYANNIYSAQCNRCGKGVAPELFLPSRNRINPLVLIAFFFMLVMILVFSRLPVKNASNLVTIIKKKIEKNESKK